MQPQRALNTGEVNRAFREFLTDTVNLDANDVEIARSSRDWLFGQIGRFEDDQSFPKLLSQFDIAYGSFARRTKKRPLDDIDLMICLHAQGSTYEPNAIPYRITVGRDSNLHDLCHDGTSFLNSTRVINKFVQKLSSVPQYSKAEIKRNGVAAVLSLTSYDWAFDIVPCFITSTENDGRTYYLIPDGSGNWMKTDPRIDRERVKRINRAHGGNVLNVIRIVKYWNKRPTMPTMLPYMLEQMILDYYEYHHSSTASPFIDFEIPGVLHYIECAVYNPVFDPAGIKGDLNSLSSDDRDIISYRAGIDLGKANEARNHETNGDQYAAIKKWAEIFGSEFPV